MLCPKIPNFSVQYIKIVKCDVLASPKVDIYVVLFILTSLNLMHNTMKIFILVFVLFYLFKYVKSIYEFYQMRERIQFYIEKMDQEINQMPGNALLFCRRGALYQELQDFPKANLDFRRAIDLINNGYPVDRKDEMLNNLNLNLQYTENPLPWTKNGPKDFSNSSSTYFLIKGFGKRRVSF